MSLHPRQRHRPEPSWLTITLWDFSWVTRAGRGEPFADLDRAFRETVARGYNAVRVDAMPLLLFDDAGRPRDRLTMVPWPGRLGKGLRWYDQRQPATIRPAEHVRALFAGAKRHGVRVIASSWEYQQTPTFLAERGLADELAEIPPARRFERLGRGMDHLLRFLSGHDLLDAVAYVELHNEVNASRLADADAADPLAAMRQPQEEALAALRGAHPGTRFTTCYTNLPPERPDVVPADVDVLHVHVYEFGPLRDLYRAVGVYDGAYPTEFARSLWRADAPPYEEHVFGLGDRWREAATFVRRPMIHLHDACDPRAFDGWLRDRWPGQHEAVVERIERKLRAYADEARRRGVPAVVGEGWIGYTPLRSRFEAGPEGKEVVRRALRRARELGYWGAVLCSNHAPHHPEWEEQTWRQLLTGAAASA